MSRSQSAFQSVFLYAFTLAIVAVSLAALYALGIFSFIGLTPNSTQGFQGLIVSQACIPGGALSVEVTNAQSIPIEITHINVTPQSQSPSAIPVSTILQSGQAQQFFVPSACTTSPHSQYSGTAVVTYVTGSQVTPGPFFSNGSYTGTSLSAYKPTLVASFNGLNGVITITGPGVNVNGTQAFTQVVWFEPLRAPTDLYSGLVSENGVCPDGSEALFINSSDSVTTEYTLFRTDHSNSCTTNNPPPFNTPLGSYYQYVFVFNGTGASVYGDGALLGGNNPAGATLDNLWAYANVITIGGEPENGVRYFSGKIANVQLYHTVLSASQVSQLYSEGIGGAPISNAGLFAWWPLDGNALDFSGNGNNGVATNVQWVSP